jgi:hypothetical protein
MTLTTRAYRLAFPTSAVSAIVASLLGGVNLAIAGSGNLAVFNGQCRFQLIRGFFPCSSKVIYKQSPDRSVLLFMRDDVLFELSGGKIDSPI